MDDRRVLRIAIHELPGLRTHERLRLAASVDRLESLARFDRSDCEAIIRREIRSERFAPSEACRRAEGILSDLTRGDFRCTFYDDHGYPPLLREIHDPPFLLYLRGQLPDPGFGGIEDVWKHAPSIAVVGTRYPTGFAGAAARRFGQECAGSSVPVVSGLALGIDAAVHRGVVEAGGQAIAVLGNGIDTVYPTSNRRLAHEILRTGGCLVSEYGPGTPAKRYHFPERNRIIAGWGRATVVVEAPGRSGALITADFVLDSGRELYVHRAGLEGRNREGVERLADDGAEVIESIEEVIDRWKSSHGYRENNVGVLFSK